MTEKTFSCPCEHLRVVISYQNIKRFPSYLVHLVAMDTKLIHLLFLFHLLHTHSSPELRAVLLHILTCQSWKSTAEIYNNNDNSCFSFRWAISRRLVVCMLHLLTRLTGSSNSVEPSLNWWYKPWIIWMCKVTSHEIKQIKVLKRRYKVAGKGNTSKVPQNCTFIQIFQLLLHINICSQYHWFLIISIDPEKCISVDPE